MRKKSIIVATTLLCGTFSYSITQAQTSTPSTPPINRIVAKANQEIIPLSEFLRSKKLLEIRNHNTTESDNQKILNQLIVMKLAYQKTKSMGLNQTALTQLRDQYYTQNKQSYNNAGYSKIQAYQEIIEEITLNFLVRKEILTPEVVKAIKNKISDPSIQNNAIFAQKQQKLAQDLLKSAYVKSCLITEPTYQLNLYQTTEQKTAENAYNTLLSGSTTTLKPKSISGTLKALPDNDFINAVKGHNAGDTLKPFHDAELGNYNIIKIVKITQPSSC